MAIPTTPPDGEAVTWADYSWRDPRSGDYISAEREDDGSVRIYVPADGEGIVVLSLNQEMMATLSAWLTQPA